MAETLALLLTQAGERLNDEDHQAFPAPMVRGWINEGCRKLARLAETKSKQTTIAVVAGTQDYTAPSDVVRLHIAQFEVDSITIPLDYTERSAAQWRWGSFQTQTAAYPQQYSTWGPPGASSMTITLFPVPSQSGTLRIFYFANATELSTTGSQDNTAVDIPAGWEDLLLDYVEARSYRRDRRIDDYQLAMQDWTNAVVAMKDTADRNYNTSPGQIIEDAMYGGGSGWAGYGYGYGF